MSQTPILDGEQPLPVRKIRWVPALLVGFALGGLLIALERTRGSPEPLIPPQAFALSLPALYVVILLHELGHLIAARAVGFELRTFMAGAFLFNKEAGGWRFRFVPRHLLWGGLTAAMPRSDEQLLGRYVWMILGGPAASLVLLIVTLTLPAVLPIRTLFWIDLILTISVCIPYTVGTFPNDAKLILLLARKGAVGDRLVAILYLLALDAQGKQPSEWPAELIKTLGVSTSDNSRMPVALALLLSDAADKEDSQRMAEILERALAMNHKMLPDVRRAFFAAAASYHGFHRGDAPRAEEWLKRTRSVRSGVLQNGWDSHALAAISFAKGAHVEAAKYLTRYIAFLDHQPLSGIVAAERTRITRMRDRLAVQA